MRSRHEATQNDLFADLTYSAMFRLTTSSAAAAPSITGLRAKKSEHVKLQLAEQNMSDRAECGKPEEREFDLAHTSGVDKMRTKTVLRMN